MKKKIEIWDSKREILLRSAEQGDCENLRIWKNNNRFSFFHQDVITSAQQQNWFHNYLLREKDFMFTVCLLRQPIGCLGFRIFQDLADIYNVILGDLRYKNLGYMSRALRMMCSYIKSEFLIEIAVVVLQNNPALDWYKRNNFQESSREQNFVRLRLNDREFVPCQLDVIQGGDLNG